MAGDASPRLPGPVAIFAIMLAAPVIAGWALLRWAFNRPALIVAVVLSLSGSAIAEPPLTDSQKLDKLLLLSTANAADIATLKTDVTALQIRMGASETREAAATAASEAQRLVLVEILATLKATEERRAADRKAADTQHSEIKSDVAKVPGLTATEIVRQFKTEHRHDDCGRLIRRNLNYDDCGREIYWRNVTGYYYTGRVSRTLRGVMWDHDGVEWWWDGCRWIETYTTQ